MMGRSAVRRFLVRGGNGFLAAAAVLGLVAGFSGCAAAPVRARPPLEEQGAVYLYLRPIPDEAVRLSFTLDSVAAVRDGGEAVPLSLRVKEISAKSVSHERLLAEGELPPGRYRGIAFGVRKASLSGAGDNSALQVPEEPVRIDVPFEVIRKRTNLLSLVLRQAESLPAEFAFTPRFTIVPAVRPPVELLGYAVNRGSNTVTAFDRVSGRVSGVIPTGASPGGLVVDPIRRSIGYVAVSGEDAVDVIDLLQGEVVDRVRLRMGDQPSEIVLTPDGSTLLALNAGSNTLSYIDTVSREEGVRISLPNGVGSILLDGTGRRAYVFHALGSGISVIDVPGRVVAATIQSESGPLRGQFNRQENRLYVIHLWSPFLLVIDPFTLTVVRKQNIGMGYQALTVDAATDRIYAARKGGNGVDSLDPFTLVAVPFLGTAGEAVFMAVDRRDRSLLMLLPAERTVRIVDLIRGATRAEIDVGEEPYWATFAAER